MASGSMEGECRGDKIEKAWGKSGLWLLDCAVWEIEEAIPSTPPPHCPENASFKPKLPAVFALFARMIVPFDRAGAIPWRYL